MLIRWQRRRPSASSDRGIFFWSRVSVGGPPAGTDTGTGSPTIGAFTGTGGGIDVKPAPALAPAPAPAVQVVFPHDDYWDEDGARPWYQRPRGYAEAQERRLQAMREEIGLLAKPAALKETEKTVERAVRALVAKAPRTEKAAFDAVASFERSYARTVRRILKTARLEDAQAAFRAEVRARIAKRAAVYEQDDEELLMLVGSMLF